MSDWLMFLIAHDRLRHLAVEPVSKFFESSHITLIGFRDERSSCCCKTKLFYCFLQSILKWLALWSAGGVPRLAWLPWGHQSCGVGHGVSTEFIEQDAQIAFRSGLVLQQLLQSLSEDDGHTKPMGLAQRNVLERNQTQIAAEVPYMLLTSSTPFALAFAQIPQNSGYRISPVKLLGNLRRDPDFAGK